MKKIIYSLLVVIFGMAITSCSSLDEESQSVLPSDAIQFTGEILPSVMEDGSRAVINVNKATQTYWELGDVMAVFATSGPQQSQVEYVVSELHEDPTKCKFLPGDYYFREGSEFASYFPLKKDYLRFTDDIPVGVQLDEQQKVWTMKGQTQIANNDASLQSQYLFMVCDPMINEDTNLFHFSYKRALSVVYTDFIVPKEGLWKSFTIQAPQGCYFYEDGIKYNFCEGGLKTANATPEQSITLTLGENGAGIKATKESDGKYHLHLFMVICPTAMTGKDLPVYVTDDTDLLYGCTVSGKNSSGADRDFFATGITYKLTGTLTSIEDSLPTGTMTGFEPEEDKSSAGGTITDFTEE